MCFSIELFCHSTPYWFGVTVVTCFCTVCLFFLIFLLAWGFLVCHSCFSSIIFSVFSTIYACVYVFMSSSMFFIDHKTLFAPCFRLGLVNPVPTSVFVNYGAWGSCAVFHPCWPPYSSLCTSTFRKNQISKKVRSENLLVLEVKGSSLVVFCKSL